MTVALRKRWCVVVRDAQDRTRAVIWHRTITAALKTRDRLRPTTDTITIEKRDPRPLLGRPDAAVGVLVWTLIGAIVVGVTGASILGVFVWVHHKVLGR